MKITYLGTLEFEEEDGGFMPGYLRVHEKDNIVQDLMIEFAKFCGKYEPSSRGHSFDESVTEKMYKITIERID